MTQAQLRDGFDLSRHAWSQLALGDAGWTQATNLVATGLMTIAAAGLRRVLRTGPAATWTPWLVAVVGVSMIVAGIFPVDPMGGFPTDLPQATAISGSAVVHLLAGAVGFPCLAAALIVLARRLAREGFGRLAVACRIVGPCSWPASSAWRPAWSACRCSCSPFRSRHAARAGVLARASGLRARTGEGRADPALPSSGVAPFR